MLPRRRASDYKFSRGEKELRRLLIGSDPLQGDGKIIHDLCAAELIG